MKLTWWPVLDDVVVDEVTQSIDLPGILTVDHLHVGIHAGQRRFVLTADVELLELCLHCSDDLFASSTGQDVHMSGNHDDRGAPRTTL